MLTVMASVSGGTSIDKAVAEAQRFAGLFLPMQIAVEFDFNGARVWVHPRTDPETIIREYEEDVGRSSAPRQKRWWRFWARPAR